MIRHVEEVEEVESRGRTSGGGNEKEGDGSRQGKHNHHCSLVRRREERRKEEGRKGMHVCRCIFVCFFFIIFACGLMRMYASRLIEIASPARGERGRGLVLLLILSSGAKLRLKHHPTLVKM